MSGLGLGRVKTPMFALRPPLSRFRFLRSRLEASYPGPIGSVNREARDALKELGAVRATPVRLPTSG